MLTETERTIKLIAKWIVNGVHADQVDALADYMHDLKHDSDVEVEVAEMLLEALEDQE